jgi:uncharacterized protein YecE (DUF72 family)
VSVVRLGTAGFSLDPAAYWARFGVVELKASALGKTPLAAAQRLGRSASPSAFIALRSPKLITHGSPATDRRRAGRRSDHPTIAPFADTRETRRLRRETIEIVHALGAKLVVLACPASLGPSPETIDRLCAFCDWAHRRGVHLGWQVGHDAWTDDELWRLCRELSLTHVVDPLVRPCVRPRPAYFRLTGLGSRRSYAPEDIDRLAAICRATTAPTERFRGVNCVFSTATAVADADRLGALLASEPLPALEPDAGQDPPREA